MTDFEIFSKPIPNNLNNRFIEFVSLEILKYLYPDKYSSLKLVDKPDLQDKENQIGVEVVEAVNNNLAQIDGEFYKYRFGKKTKEEKEKCRRTIERNGATVDEFGITYPVQYSNEELDILKYAIEKKIEKFDNYSPNEFKVLDLFVMYPSYLMPHSDIVLNDFFKYIGKINNKKYGRIFIFSGGVLITIKTDTSEWNVKRFKRKQYDRFMLNVKERFIEIYLQ